MINTFDYVNEHVNMSYPCVYLEESQDVGHHDGHRAGRGSYHSHHALRFADDGRLSVGAANIRCVLLDQCLDKGEGLFQGIRVPGAGVQDASAQRNVGQQLRVAVDLVQSVQHGLHAVDALLLLQLSAGQTVGAPAMYGEQATECDVTWDLYGVRVEVLVGPSHLDHGSTDPQP